MAPGKYNLALYRGDTGRWRFTFWEDTAHTVPFDLTGAVVKSEIRDKSGGTKIVELDCVVSLPNIIDAELTAGDSALTPAAGVWDLQLTWPDGTVRTMVGGTVAVTGDVTDSVTPVAAARLRSA